MKPSLNYGKLAGLTLLALLLATAAVSHSWASVLHGQYTPEALTTMLTAYGGAVATSFSFTLDPHHKPADLAEIASATLTAVTAIKEANEKDRLTSVGLPMEIKEFVPSPVELSQTTHEVLKEHITDAVYNALSKAAGVPVNTGNDANVTPH